MVTLNLLKKGKQAPVHVQFAEIVANQIDALSQSGSKFFFVLRLTASKLPVHNLRRVNHFAAVVRDFINPLQGEVRIWVDPIEVAEDLLVHCLPACHDRILGVPSQIARHSSKVSPLCQQKVTDK